MRWRRSPGRPITSPRAEPGSRRTRPLPHPSPWRWGSAARPRHLGAGPGGGSVCKYVYVKIRFRFPGSGKKCSPGPLACKGLQLRGRGLASCTPLLGMFIAIAPRRPTIRISLGGSCPVYRVQPAGEPNVANFRHSPCTEGIDLWESGLFESRE